MIEISIHIFSLVIGFIIGLIAMGIIMISFELIDFDRTGIDIKHGLIELEAKLAELKKEEV